MNIMYVIVTERISEVGLKKAIGARNKDVLYEFLYEAIMLTLLGGILGIVVGIAASYGIAQIANLFGLTWEFSVPISGILISVIVSTAIGVIFGVFPARNAEKLSPIEALRYEP
jgi:putative ABC transport system permease protein